MTHLPDVGQRVFVAHGRLRGQATVTATCERNRWVRVVMDTGLRESARADEVREIVETPAEVVEVRRDAGRAKYHGERRGRVG